MPMNEVAAANLIAQFATELTLAGRGTKLVLSVVEDGETRHNMGLVPSEEVEATEKMLAGLLRWGVQAVKFERSSRDAP